MTRIGQEQKVLKLAGVKGRIKRKDVMDLCHLGMKQAYVLIQNLFPTVNLSERATIGGRLTIFRGQIRDKNWEHRRNIEGT